MKDAYLEKSSPFYLITKRGMKIVNQLEKLKERCNENGIYLNGRIIQKNRTENGLIKSRIISCLKGGQNLTSVEISHILNLPTDLISSHLVNLNVQGKVMKIGSKIVKGKKLFTWGIKDVRPG